jgi:hypothetical protein
MGCDVLIQKEWAIVNPMEVELNAIKHWLGNTQGTSLLRVGDNLSREAL